MADKLLHIVGGGYNQITLVQKARAMGLKILVTDMYENPPCRALADFYERIDTTDKYKTLDAAVKYKVDAVVTDQTDVAVPTVAYIAETLHLPGIGYETALRFTNKYLMREALKNKLPHAIPEFHFFDDPAKAIEFCKAHQNIEQYLVKPINSQGSKGVFKLRLSNYTDAVSHAFLESKSRGILIEEYLDGFEYSVEAFKEDDKVYNLAITKKYHYNSNDCIDERNTWLGDIAPELEKQLFELNESVIRALNLSFGITHAEYKFHRGKPYLMEIAARGGGGSISSKIIPFLTEFEPAVALLNKVFGKPNVIQYKDYKSKFAILKFFNFTPGKIRKIHINRHATEGLMEFNMDLKDGDMINLISDSRDRPGYFIVSGSNREAVISKEKTVEEAVQIEYEFQQNEKVIN